MKSILFAALCCYTLAACAQSTSKVITTNTDNDLIPEGIAVDERTGTIYISSIAKNTIVAINPKGEHTFFIKPGQDGYLQGLGMKIDYKRNWLWSVSNHSDSGRHTSRLHAFDLKTGKTQQQYNLVDTAAHLFNDLVLDSEGNILFTDTYYSALYKVNPSTRSLELVTRTPQLDYPNGLVFGSKPVLYIATYNHGLIRYNPATRELQPLTGYKDSAMAHGLDGLVYWNNTLVGVYNSGEGRATNAVVQYFLNEAGDRIVGEAVIDKGHPAFYEPTTASITGNQLYVLANSHLAAYNANKESTAGIKDKLLPISIVTYALKKN